MAISYNVGTNQSYSNLFQGISSGSGMSNTNFLADYASIKNGSYGKLMKSYYGTMQSSGSTASSSSRSSSGSILDKILEERRNPKVSKDTQESNTNLTAGLSSLKNSVTALQNDATYKDTEGGQNASQKVTSALKTFVSDYNGVVNAAKGSTLSSTSYVASMMRTTSANADKLSEIGITVNSNGTLNINEDKLKAADTAKVEELFSAGNITSYGSTIASRLKFANAATTTTASASSTTSTDSTTAAATGAAGLKADAQALASDALYEKIKDKDGSEKYNIDKILSTAKSFVNNYNYMFDSIKNPTNSGVVSNLSYIKNKTASNKDALKQFGIDVDDKGKMKIDEEKFKNSDMSKVQEFFKDYGSSIATNASLVDYYLTTQANAANSYTADGTYDVQGGIRYASSI